MWQKISLRTRIYLILIVLASITIAGGLVMIWYTYRMENLLTLVTEKDLAAFETAEALEKALINQKGFVSYYFIEGDPEWLKQLGEYRQLFKDRLNDALQTAVDPRERTTLDRIRAEYTRYITTKDRVIDYYQKGDREAGAILHRQVRDTFFTVLQLCEKYRDIHKEKILKASSESASQALKLRIVAATAVVMSALLALLLAFVLGYQVLGPVRRLTLEAGRKAESPVGGDEVKTLSDKVRGLIQNVDQTQSELQKSRESLLQAEKMALVGKLAAGMAHSIRNPFTSVKMRLFSLSRSLELFDTQKEDFEVISEEIRHIDTIVQNFLEFSRPPKLKMQSISPSAVVDQTLQLLEHRLKSYDVSAMIEREQPLPEIDADPEQLKEVLVNLMVNACEAIEKGGTIVIHEDKTRTSSDGSVAVIRVSDDGPGIPEAIRAKVFEPFFTTKEEGTGLGLSIVARIIEEHGGSVAVESIEGQGTTFIISLPIMEVSHEQNPHHRR
jgi:signal transduction histidine kinase